MDGFYYVDTRTSPFVILRQEKGNGTHVTGTWRTDRPYWQNAGLMRLGTTYKRADDAEAMRKLVKTRWDKHFRETKHVIGPGSKRVLKRTVLDRPSRLGRNRGHHPEHQGRPSTAPSCASCAQKQRAARRRRRQRRQRGRRFCRRRPAMVEADATPPLVGIELPEDQAVWEKVLDALKDITPPPRHPGPSVKPEEPPIKPEPAPMPPGGMMPPGWDPVQISL